ncbi:sororin [Nothobranchius furzeri]|uniref:Cell division cycle associated 5 n=2 Tax=Nothobranchius TaxID=28779 RepID=A0A1A7ZYF6_NOTFU|nr:sororin [Nothobranchius furzeri]KAF7211600.1 cell division cycle associated 5 [Nothobranchius furzeri]
MDEGSPHGAMAGANGPLGPQRRRSPRFSSPQAPLGGEKMALGIKRSITVRKIAPRKTSASSKHNKENTPRHSEQVQQLKTKVSTPDPGPDRRASSSAARKKQQAPMPSRILPSSPPDSCRTQQPAAEPEAGVCAQKARRSYSRLSDSSLHSSPDSRETLFGFERLRTPEVVRKSKQTRDALEVSGPITSFTESTDEGFAEPDPNIPGVSVSKERRRRRKVPQIDSAELDHLAAQMNAEFREAEEFELVVE